MAAANSPVMGQVLTAANTVLVTFPSRMEALFIRNATAVSAEVRLDSLASNPYTLGVSQSVLNLADITFYRMYITSAGASQLDYIALAEGG